MPKEGIASPCRGRAGFTLIELLIVISIVAILASLLLPGLARAREYAYFTVCKSNLHQMGIGFLTYASDNYGELPRGYSLCEGGPLVTNKGRENRTNGVNTRAGTTDGRPQGMNCMVPQLYDDTGWPYSSETNGKGYSWTSTTLVNGWRGKPRLPGKYLSIEALWCPIPIVRSWDYYYSLNKTKHADSEEHRDFISRSLGYFGYSFFVYQVGCTANWAPHHLVSKYAPDSLNLTDSSNIDGKMRLMTKFVQPHVSNPPSVWLAADHTPSYDTKSTYNVRVPTHFGATVAWPDFRFNVLHMDGHVHNDVSQDYEWLASVQQGPGYTDAWRKEWEHNNYWDAPYGWLWEDLWPVEDFPDREIYTIIEGAFDKNKTER